MKKFISILLAVMLIASVAVSAGAYSVWEEVLDDDGNPLPNKLSDAIAAYEAETGEKVDVYRYYFQMPDGTNGPVKKEDDEAGKVGDHSRSWINEHNVGYCGIYYWATGSFPTPKGWTGYQAEKLEGVPNVWYADVPGDVLTIIWNNGVDGGQDESNPLFFNRAQTSNLKIEYLDPGENSDFPDGLGEEDVPGAFANMIYIIDPDKTSVNEYSQAQECGGRWYFYLGDGCYAATADGECCNPDHFDADGNHVGYQEPVTEPDPTEPDPTEPDPTEPAPQKLLGDVDGDGFVTVMDATKIQKFKAAILTEEDIDASPEAADVDGDTFVTVMDATRIQKFKAKIMNLDGTTPYVEA